MPTFLKTLALAPLLIGGSIAMMMLAYLFVPLLVVSFFILVAYGIVKVLQDIEAREIIDKEK